MRISKLSFVLLVAAAVLPACSSNNTTKTAAPATATQAVSAGNTKSPPPPVRSLAASYLFVQSATGGSFTPSTGGNFTLSLTGVEPSVLYFADRPNRESGYIPIDTMVGELGYKKGDPPPNAAINVIGAAENEDVRAVELTNPRYDAAAKSMTWDAHPLTKMNSRGLSDLNKRADDHIPEKFGGASLFIDDTSHTCTVELVNAVRGVGDLTIVSQSKWSTDSWDETPPPVILSPDSGQNSSGWWESSAGLFRGCSNSAQYTYSDGTTVSVTITNPYSDPNTWNCTVSSPQYTCELTTDPHGDAMVAGFAVITSS